MLPHLEDTIVALSSPSGSGARAVVRLSGPAALTIVTSLFHTAVEISPTQRRCHNGEVRLPDVAAPLPADLYFWPPPRTYTGQPMAELHVLSCPPLVDLLIASLLQRGARAAQAGEFTMRAFLAGKLDLPRAEAVLGVIEAGDRDELKRALAQLAGGVTRPLEGVREDLLNLLADLEAGLDFAEEDVHFISQEDLLQRLSAGLAQLTLVQKQLTERAVSGQCFRAVLAGRPNAGKSSLFNALVGAGSALVSPQAGTTRDYLVGRVAVGGLEVDLIDTAGWRPAADTIEEQAQTLGHEQVQAADLLLLCVEAAGTINSQERELLAGGGVVPVVGVATKCDLATAPSGMIATSVVSGAGLDALRQLLAERARQHARPAPAPSVSRCRNHIAACLDRLRRAHQVALFEDGPELLALELRGALDELGEMVGAVYTDDLLGRIFSRFCIGK